MHRNLVISDLFTALKLASTGDRKLILVKNSGFADVWSNSEKSAPFVTISLQIRPNLDLKKDRKGPNQVQSVNYGPSMNKKSWNWRNLGCAQKQILSILLHYRLSKSLYWSLNSCKWHKNTRFVFKWHDNIHFWGCKYKRKNFYDVKSTPMPLQISSIYLFKRAIGGPEVFGNTMNAGLIKGVC